MNVLGVNGIQPRSHDASACLVNGQEIVAFAEEERFIRSKRAFDRNPTESQTYCLQSAGNRIADVDVITFGWKGLAEMDATDILPQQYLQDLNDKLPVIEVEHHEAHAASVFYTSPFETAAVLVIDGQGENESTTIWSADNRGLTKLQSEPVDRSLGYFYGAVSKFCGFGSFGAGKLMGLAPYGEPLYVERLAEIYEAMTLPQQDGHDSQDIYFERFIAELEKQGFKPAQYSYIFNEATAQVRPEPELTQAHRDLAASAQKFLESKVLDLANQAKKLTGLTNLCMAGGVAMNCVTNSQVQDSGLFEDVFVQPACEDSGMALGSALAVTRQKTPLDSVYLGPSFDDKLIEELLQSYGIPARRSEKISEDVAQLLARDLIVGWFQGGMEFGPRALGGRSILANPSSTQTRDRVNKVKSRESWRPFGPSVIAEEAANIFVNSHESSYMLRSFAVKDEWRKKMAGVVHVDGSTRPQTVTQQANKPFYETLEEFFRLTGLPGVINTSFNDYNEPIVAKPQDAIKTFYSTGLDALAIGNFLIQKS